MQFQIGIEKISFYTPNYCISHKELAKKTKQDEDKYIKGLGQHFMSILPPYEDIITMAYNSIVKLIDRKTKENDDIRENIDMLIFATESGIDNSKSSAIVLHGLLGLKENCRCIDVKQACYGGTGAILFAKNFLISEMIGKNNIKSKVLVVMSDVAYYGLNTSGEATQGCGAVAILISFEPKVCVFEDGICDNKDERGEVFENVLITENSNDFYRPSFSQTPLYDGHFSIKKYLTMFLKAKRRFKNYDKLDIICSHMPFAKMMNKCIPEQNDNGLNELINYLSSIVGNIYTGSLYLGLLSLITQTKQDLTNKYIGMFSYGSGAECELFAIKILQNYKEHLEIDIEGINNRIQLDYDEYHLFWQKFADREKQLNWKVDFDYKKDKKAKVFLVEMKNGVRKYEMCD